MKNDVRFTVPTQTIKVLRTSQERNVWGNRNRSLIVFVALFIVLVPVFWLNAMGTADTKSFDSWQRDSESLVLAKIESERVDKPFDTHGMVRAAPDIYSVYKTIDLPNIGATTSATATYRAYDSQLGAMGYFYSALYLHTPCSSLSCLHLTSSTLFSLTLVALVYLLGLLARRSFAIIFLLSVIGSPWLVTSARNLYWSPWTWLLPTCAAALFVLAKRRRWRVASLALLFVAFVIRFGSGYEFLTSLSLMAIAMPVLAFLFAVEWSRGIAKRALKDALSIFLVSIGAFVIVLLVHGYVRGNGSIFSGISAIVQKDVLRRTYGSATSFDPIYGPSLKANVGSVLHKYLFEWRTDFISIGSGAPLTLTLGRTALWTLIGICVVIIALRFAKRDSLWIRDSLLIGITAAIPLSWFVLAKSHSFIHIVINFVLWYLLFAGALFFVIYNFLVTQPLVGTLRTRISRKLPTNEKNVPHP